MSILSICFIFVFCLQSQTKTFDGYTFVFSGKKVYLYDMDKKVLNTWTVQNNIEGCADLLRDSSIIVSAKAPNSTYSLALPHGRFQIINWKGEVTWDYTYSSSEYTPHHDIEPVYRTNDPKEKPTFLVPCYTSWGDKIVELKPTGKTTAEVIWEWNGSDHNCESGCSDKADVMDKSKGGVGCFNKTSDAMHVNNVSYNRTLDQIIVNCKGFNELFVIDRSTTTAQAKTSSGGKYGKGGRILYRWGSPSNYGISSEKKAFNGQHHGCWVPDTMPGTNLPIPGAGNFMAVDNGNKRVIEFLNPAKNGVFSRTAGQAFEPKTILWTYTPSGLASNEGSIQKLPNGNYLICTGGVSGGFGFGGGGGGGGGSSGSKVYEVAPNGTSGGTVVWELGDFGYSTEGYRYAYGYLNQSTPIKKLSSNQIAGNSYKITTMCSNNHTLIRVNNFKDNAHITLFSLSGKMLCSGFYKTQKCITFDPGIIPKGIYLVSISTENHKITDRVSIH